MLNGPIATMHADSVDSNAHFYDFIYKMRLESVLARSLEVLLLYTIVHIVLSTDLHHMEFTVKLMYTISGLIHCLSCGISMNQSFQRSTTRVNCWRWAISWS